MMTKEIEFEFNTRDANVLGIDLEPLRQRKREKELIKQTVNHAVKLDYQFKGELSRIELYTSHACIELDRMNMSTYTKYMDDVFTTKEYIIGSVDVTNEDTRLWLLSKGIINIGRYAMFKMFEKEIKKAK